MSGAHTQGPWRHEGQGDITGTENDPENGCVGPVDVACVYLRTVPGRSEANINLIAAAPDLIEACQYMLQHAFERKWAGDERGLALLNSAIAKATGGRS